MPVHGNTHSIFCVGQTALHKSIGIWLHGFGISKHGKWWIDRSWQVCSLVFVQKHMQNLGFLFCWHQKTCRSDMYVSKSAPRKADHNTIASDFLFWNCRELTSWERREWTFEWIELDQVSILKLTVFWSVGVTPCPSERGIWKKTGRTGHASASSCFGNGRNNGVDQYRESQMRVVAVYICFPVPSPGPGIACI